MRLPSNELGCCRPLALAAVLVEVGGSELVDDVRRPAGTSESVHLRESLRTRPSFTPDLQAISIEPTRWPGGSCLRPRRSLVGLVGSEVVALGQPIRVGSAAGAVVVATVTRVIDRLASIRFMARTSKSSA